MGYFNKNLFVAKCCKLTENFDLAASSGLVMQTDEKGERHANELDWELRFFTTYYPLLLDAAVKGYNKIVSNPYIIETTVSGAVQILAKDSKKVLTVFCNIGNHSAAALLHEQALDAIIFHRGEW